MQRKKEGKRKTTLNITVSQRVLNVSKNWYPLFFCLKPFKDFTQRSKAIKKAMIIDQIWRVSIWSSNFKLFQNINGLRINEKDIT